MGNGHGVRNFFLVVPWGLVPWLFFGPWGQVPWLHLAIDTEFHVKEGQIPRVDLGTDNGKEVQEAIEYY
jgi:hypothetical protein